jgi:hypothetical protein
MLHVICYPNFKTDKTAGFAISPDSPIQKVSKRLALKQTKASSQVST